MMCHMAFRVSLFSWICITLISLLTLVFSYCMLQTYIRCKFFLSILLHYMLHVYVCSLMWMYLAKFVLFICLLFVLLAVLFFQDMISTTEWYQKTKPPSFSRQFLNKMFCISSQDLRSELEENQSAVMTLRETADQLLVSGELPEMSSARDKTHIISNRLRSLLHLTAAYIESLETKLGVKVDTSSCCLTLNLSSIAESLGHSLCLVTLQQRPEPHLLWI